MYIALVFVLNIIIAQTFDWQENGVAIRQGVHVEWMRTADIATDGNFIYSWSDTRTGERDIYVQKVDSQGNKLWPEDAIAVTYEGRQEDPQLVGDGNGGAYLIWNDYRSETNNFANPPAQLYAQHINSDGEISWSISGEALGSLDQSQVGINICKDGLGGAYVIWSEVENQVVKTYATHMTPTGILNPGMGTVIIELDHSYSIGMSLETASDGDAVMAWKDSRNGDSNTDIYAQRISINSDGDLVTLWPNDGFPLCIAEGNQGSPRVAPYNGTYSIIAWEDSRLDAISGSSMFGIDIFAQFVDVNMNYPSNWQQNGNPISIASFDQKKPRIKSYDETAYIVWGDLRNGEDVFIQRLRHDEPNGLWASNYNSEVCGPMLLSYDNYCLDDNSRVDGKRVSLTNDIDTSDIPRSQEEVRLTAGASGVWVVYEDQIPDDIPSLDIFVQNFNLEGEPTFVDGGISVSSANYSQEAPIIRADDNGGVFTIWQDRRNGSTAIYTQYLTIGGVQLSTNGVELNSGIDWDGGLVDDEYNNYNKSKAHSKSIYLGSNQTFVYWMDNRIKASTFYQNTYWETYNSYGSVINSVFGSSSSNGSNANGSKLSNFMSQKSPRVNVLNDGYMLSYVGIDLSVGESKVMYETLNSNLVNPSSDLTSSTLSGDEGYALQNDFISVFDENQYVYTAYNWQYAAFGGVPGEEFSRVKIQKYDNAGVKQWSDDVYVAFELFENMYVRSIHTHLDGGAIVVYEKDALASTLHAAYINSSGSLVWNTSLTIMEDSNQEFLDSVVMSHGVYVIFSDSRSNDLDIYGQLISFSGSRISDVNGDALCAASSDQSSASLDVLDSLDEFLVCWEDGRNGASDNKDIYCRGGFLNENSTLDYYDEVELSLAAGNQQNPYVKSTQRGTYLVAWEDGRGDDLWTDIYVQEYGVNFLGFDSNGVSIGVGVHNQSNPQIQLLTEESNSSALSYLVFWDDFRSSGKEWYRNIFAQRVVLDGELSSNNNDSPNSFILFDNYPNPFNPSTTIKYENPSLSYVSLVIYDINGREISRLVSQMQSAGTYSVLWDGNDLSGNNVASGIYFAVLESGNIRLQKKLSLLK